MALGGLGLTKSFNAEAPDLAKILSTIVAVIGFFGEAPFSIAQGRLLVAKLSPSNVPLAEPQNNKTCLSYTKIFGLISTTVYASGYLAGSYANIDFEVPGKIAVAAGSSYLALISSLTPDTETEDSKPLLEPHETESAEPDLRTSV